MYNRWQPGRQSGNHCKSMKKRGEKMKSTFTTLLFLFAAAQIARAQPPAKLTDVYRVTFLKSAPGKAAQLSEDLKAQGAKAPMPGHFLLLRHLSGDDWDYAVIEHN